MSAARRPRRAAIAAAVATAALVLSACAGQQAGSAATLGADRITEQALASNVEEVFAAQGLPTDSADELITQETLSRMIIIDLVDILAERTGVAVSQGRLDQELQSYIAQSGDRDAMVASFTQQGIAPSMIEDIIRLNLLATDLGVALAPDGAPEEQGQAVFDAVSALSVELGVETSPRFGTWDPTALQVGPVSDGLAILPALAS
ncbi:MAG: SurA N-terminal domain-containing protein [Actinomycetota bacterium]|nr:SurA N-terminal domain-containing protein [Actinomycetota bacterium]